MQEAHVQGPLLVMKTSPMHDSFLEGLHSSGLGWSQFNKQFKFLFSRRDVCLAPRLPWILGTMLKAGLFLWMAVFMEQYVPMIALFAKPTVVGLLFFTSQTCYCNLSDDLHRFSHIRLDCLVAMVSGHFSLKWTFSFWDTARNQL